MYQQLSVDLALYRDRSGLSCVVRLFEETKRTISKPGLTLSVRKKPEVADKRVYRISRKFIGFAVFLSDKIYKKNSSNYTQNNLDDLQTI